jgi:hypothetical protein
MEAPLVHLSLQSKEAVSAIGPERFPISTIKEAREWLMSGSKRSRVWKRTSRIAIQDGQS